MGAYTRQLRVTKNAQVTMVCEHSGSTKNGPNKAKITSEVKSLLVVSSRSYVLASTIHGTCALLIKACDSPCSVNLTR